MVRLQRLQNFVLGFQLRLRLWTALWWGFVDLDGYHLSCDSMAGNINLTECSLADPLPYLPPAAHSGANLRCQILSIVTTDSLSHVAATSVQKCLVHRDLVVLTSR